MKDPRFDRIVVVMALCAWAGCAAMNETIRRPPPRAERVACPNITVSMEGNEPVWETHEDPVPDNVARFLGGELRLPSGWSHVCTRGHDSATGWLQGPGELRIDYDIGGYNAVLAQEGISTHIARVRTEEIEGVKLHYGFRGAELIATLHLVRPANFVAWVVDDEESEVVIRILRGFRPTPCATRLCRASGRELARMMLRKSSPTLAATPQ